MESGTIAAGVRTVATLADHFERLKIAARTLEATLNPVGRGYFTAVEDDQVQALVVGYWQARSALLELIHEYRDYAEREGDDRHVAFLLAFTSALVLVDAARVLRELADRRPVVRKRLNLPVAAFQIPGGLYDSIQGSMISARHAWHLYHAVRYFQQHERMLRIDAQRLEMLAVMDVIDRLRERINVTFDQFARARLRTRGDQLTRRLGRNVVLRAVYGTQKVVASMMADRYVRPGHAPMVPPPVVEYLAEVIQPGDVLVVRKEYALTNYFLPGYWPHAALYLGQPGQLKAWGLDRHAHVSSRWERLEVAAGTHTHVVLESMKDGVLFRSWYSPLRSDSFVLLRPQLTLDLIVQGIARAIHHEGKSYDFDFDFGRSDRLVCTEVIYRAYDGLGDLQFPLRRRAGRPTLSGSDLVRLAASGQCVRPVLVFAPGLCPGTHTGEQARHILEQALARG